MTRKSLISLVLLLFLHGLAGAEKYYVTQDSAGTGDGSSYENSVSVADFNSGNLGELEGDTVYLCDNITSHVEVPDGGAIGNYLTIKGDYVGHKVNMTHRSSYGAIRISGKSYIVLDGLTVNGYPRDAQEDGQKNGICVLASVISGCHYITVKKCIVSEYDKSLIRVGRYSDNPENRNSHITIGGAKGDGNTVFNCGSGTGSVNIGVSKTDTYTVSYNHIYGSGDETVGIDGITCENTTKGILEHNVIHGHREHLGIEFGEDGIDLKLCSDIDIRYNVIYNNRVAGITVSNYSNDNIRIYGNYVYENMVGILIGQVKEGTTIKIFGNIVASCNRAITTCGGIQATAAKTGSGRIGYCYIYGNTLVYNSGPNNDKYDMDVSNADNVYIKNNIFYCDDIGKCLRKSASATNIILNSNQYYYDDGSITVNWDGIDRNLSWLQEQGYEVNGAEGNPFFTNYVGADYTLLEKSPARNEGENLGDTMGFNVALHPSTNWITTPPTVTTANQNNYGSGWEKGAYVYTGNIITGDLTGDGQVNVQDVQACVNVILGVETTPEIIQRAKEVTKPKDECNVLDIQAIVNIVLGG